MDSAKKEIKRASVRVGDRQTPFVPIGRFVLEAGMTAATQLTERESRGRERKKENEGELKKKDSVFSLFDMQATGSVLVHRACVCLHMCVSGTEQRVSGRVGRQSLV